MSSTPPPARSFTRPQPEPAAISTRPSKRPATPSIPGPGRNSPAPSAPSICGLFPRKLPKKRQFLARLEVADNGKPLPEALWDMDDAAGCFAYYAALAEELDQHPEETIPLSEPRFSSRVVREPLGVVGAITPWNYPLLMVAWKVAPALAAGCTIVLKTLGTDAADRARTWCDRRGHRSPGWRAQHRHRHRNAGRRTFDRTSAGRQARLYRLGLHRPQGDDGRRPGHQDGQPGTGRQIAFRDLCRQRYRKSRRMDHVRHLLETRGQVCFGNLARAGGSRALRRRRFASLRGSGQDQDRQRFGRGHAAWADRLEGPI